VYTRISMISTTATVPTGHDPAIRALPVGESPASSGALKIEAPNAPHDRAALPGSRETYGSAFPPTRPLPLSIVAGAPSAVVLARRAPPRPEQRVSENCPQRMALVPAGRSAETTADEFVRQPSATLTLHRANLSIWLGSQLHATPTPPALLLLLPPSPRVAGSRAPPFATHPPPRGLPRRRLHAAPALGGCAALAHVRAAIARHKLLHDHPTTPRLFCMGFLLTSPRTSK
jgi:hypothetical protein